ncbi:MAG: hypothetical protein ACYTEZ_13220 [Planctomycetota bacterium]|jgi:hypothetical protein
MRTALVILFFCGASAFVLRTDRVPPPRNDLVERIRRKLTAAPAEPAPPPATKPEPVAPPAPDRAADTWFLSTGYQLIADWNRIYRRIGAKYPELNHYRRDPEHQRHATSNPVDCQPRIYRVRWKAIVDLLRDNKAANRPPEHGLETALLLHRGPFRVRLECGGQRRFFYFAQDREGAFHALGNPEFCGLENGTHPVAMTVVLEDGTRIHQVLTVAVRLRASTDDATPAVARSRRRLAREPTPANAFDLYQNLMDEALHCVRFTADTARVSAILEEMPQRLRVGRPKGITPQEEIQEAHDYVMLCFGVGTPKAYALANDLWTEVQGRVAGDADLTRGGAIENRLAHLAAGSGNLRAARAHYERYLAYLARADPERERSLDWWPPASPID